MKLKPLFVITAIFFCFATLGHGEFRQIYSHDLDTQTLTLSLSNEPLVNVIAYVNASFKTNIVIPKHLQQKTISAGSTGRWNGVLSRVLEENQLALQREGEVFFVVSLESPAEQTRLDQVSPSTKAQNGPVQVQANSDELDIIIDSILDRHPELDKASEDSDLMKSFLASRDQFIVQGYGLGAALLKAEKETFYSQSEHLPTKEPVTTEGSLSERNIFFTLMLSAILTWGVGLAPPLLLRFAFIKYPLSKPPALITVIFLWVFNFGLFTALGRESKTHGALLLVAWASYAILRKGSAKYEEEQARQREEEIRKSEEKRKKEEERRRTEEESRRKKEKENEQEQQKNYNQESNSIKDEEYYRNILGLASSFTVEEIKRRYRELVAKYHPDKVNHLGEKLKETAEREMKEINEAYEYFKKKYNFK